MLEDSTLPAKDRLRAFLAAGNRVALVATAIHRSGNTLSSYLQGQFKGDEKRLERALGRFLSRQNLQESPAFKPDFCMTSVAEDIIGALFQAQIDGDIALVVGPSGVGKTWAAAYYANSEPGAYLVTATPAWSTQSLVASIARRLELDRASKLLDLLLAEVTEALRDSGALVIVDEAQHLNSRSLETLRGLYDETGIGLAFVAQLQFYALLQRGDGRVSYDQLMNRVGVRLTLREAGLDDLTMLLPPATPASVVKYLHTRTGGCLRAAVKTYARACRVAATSGDGAAVTLQLVKELLGDQRQGA